MPNKIIKTIIPAQNEEQAIAQVIGSIPAWVHEIIVVDNGSRDNTAKLAHELGARVIAETKSGYGLACLAGIKAAIPCDIFVFLDGDASDFPEDMDVLLAPIFAGEADMVIGSRVLGTREAGALTLQQQLGNGLACWLIYKIWGHRYTDLGPFRAITREGLEVLDMQAPSFGWTVEMQVRALKKNLRVKDVPVRYRKRIGRSKISGTVKGVIMAGIYILATIFKEALKP